MTGVNSIKVIISEGRPAWEITIIDGSKISISYIPTEILADYSLIATKPESTPCAGIIFTISGIAAGYILYRRE